jgi:hypothetical protein
LRAGVNTNDEASAAGNDRLDEETDLILKAVSRRERRRSRGWSESTESEMRPLFGVESAVEAYSAVPVGDV